MNFPILSIIIFLPLVGVLFILLNSGDEIKVKKTSFRVSLLTSLLVFIQFQSGFLYHYAFVILIGLSILLTYIIIF